MAYKWIIGDFATGNISENNELPVVLNKGDKITTDVNADETATITVSMNDLPSDWRTYLSPVNKMVAYIDTDAVWSSAVVWAGFINKVSASVNDTVKIQAVGLKEYMKVRSTNNIFASTNTNPKATVDFNGSNYQSLMGRIIQSCFSTTGISTTHPRPPQVLISVATSTASGTAATYSVPVNDAEFYANILDTLRDDLSDAGQEYWFVPQWRSSSKTQIGWVAYVGSVSVPHRQENTTLTVNLGDGNNNTYKPTAFGQTASSDNMVSRIIGISKEGDDKNPSDLTTKTTRTYTSILIDEFWNPGVELTNSQLNTQLSERLSYNSQTFKESNFTTVFDDKSYIKIHSLNIGKMATFTSSGNVQNFGLTMRVVGVSVSFGGNTAEIELAPKAARYPRLPKDGRNLKPRTEAPKTGRPKTGPGGTITGPGGRGGPGDYVNPITPTPKPGYNGTTPIPGGVVSPEDVKEIIDQEKKPPFTVPNDDYQDDNPVITSSEEVRLFKTPLMLKEEDGNTGGTAFDFSKYSKKYIDPTRARFNHKTGEYIGLNMPYQTRYHQSRGTDDSYYYVGDKFVDLEIYSYDFNSLFEPHTGAAYQDSTLGSINNTHPIIGDNHKKLVAVIPQSVYHDISLSILNFAPQIPQGSNVRSYSAIRGVYDYSFFCSEDFQTLYVSIVYNISGWSIVDNKTKSWSYTSNKVLKGVRNGDGVVESWADLGDAFATQDITGDYIYHSPNIYELNGNFVSFGGYILPQLEQGVDINEVRTDSSFKGVPKLPYYSMKFYNNRIAYVDLNNFYPTPVGLNLNIPDYYGTDTVMSEFQIPYAVKVDYARRKICVGISRGPNNTSIFYEMSLDFSDIVKVLQTQKETKEIAYVKGTAGSSAYKINESVFKFSLNTPVFYKGNYILLNAEGYDTLTERGLRYTRGKKGFDDSVSGKLNFPDISGTGYNIAVKDGLLLSNYNANLGNKIGAFHSYFTHAWGEIGVASNTLLTSGFDYFAYNGKIYIVSNSFFRETYAATPEPDFTRGYHTDKTITWVGKFNMDDSKIIQQ